MLGPLLSIALPLPSSGRATSKEAGLGPAETDDGDVKARDEGGVTVPLPLGRMECWLLDADDICANASKGEWKDGGPPLVVRARGGPLGTNPGWPLGDCEASPRPGPGDAARRLTAEL